MLNVLIAKMDEIQEESEHNHNEWIRQVKLFFILLTTINKITRLMVLQNFRSLSSEIFIFFSELTTKV